MKRSIIKGIDYVITMTSSLLKLTIKGRRRGMELNKVDYSTGERALALASHASVGQV